MEKKKKDLMYNIFYIGIYVAFALASIFVLVFEFTTLEFSIITALVLYVIAFGFLTVAECLGVIELKKKLKSEANAQDKIEKSEDGDVLPEDVKTHAEAMEEIKTKINWGYVKVVLSALVCVFAFVVLVLF
ncbi:MAG: hypothetical protein IJS68_01445 [Clostridia bacterium]|nr:hypothetical protein [Clostridia bacterium]